MIRITANEKSLLFTFTNSNHYFQNGTVEVPKNSLALIVDDSDMATFKKSASADIFISASYTELGMSKSELISWFEENGFSEGGGGLTPEEAQEMIDESISGKTDLSAFTSYSASVDTALSNKADATAVTAEISAAVSGKADTTAMTTALADKVDVSAFTAYTSATDTALSGKASQSDLNTLSGDVIDIQTALQGKADTSDLANYVEVTAYTAYTSSTETTINGKASQSDLNTLSGNVDTLSGQVADKADTTAMTTALADKLDISTFETYSGSVDTALSGKASQSDLNTLSGDVATVSGAVANKQDLLVSGTNIKTINNTSLLGSGDITIQGGGQTVTSVTQSQYDSLTTKDPDTFYIISDATGSSITIDSSLDSGSTNPVENSAITTAINAVSGDVDTLSGAVANKVDTSAYTAYTSSTQTAIGAKASQTDLETLSGNVATVSGQVDNKQDTLVSGTNIKTINSQSLLGSGDIVIQGGGTVDSALTLSSNNAVANSAITKAIQDNELVVANALIALQDDVDTVSAATASNTTALGGFSIVKMTSAEYEALVTKSPTTIYFIVD